MFFVGATNSHAPARTNAIRSGSIGELHLFQERLPARVAVQVLQQRVELYVGNARIALHVCALEPVECDVRRAKKRKPLRDLISGTSGVLVAELSKGRLRLGR